MKWSKCKTNIRRPRTEGWLEMYRRQHFSAVTVLRLSHVGWLIKKSKTQDPVGKEGSNFYLSPMLADTRKILNLTNTRSQLIQGGRGRLRPLQRRRLLQQNGPRQCLHKCSGSSTENAGFCFFLLFASKNYILAENVWNVPLTNLQLLRLVLAEWCAQYGCWSWNDFIS